MWKMKKPITETIKSKRLYFDGATGSVLLERGLPAGVPPEEWNITNPDEIVRLHKEYLAAGADIIKTNTFGINPLKYGDYAVRIKGALSLAKSACMEYDSAYVALDVGPLGRLISPLGDLAFEDAVEAFRKTVAAGCDNADLILLETFNDSYEVKAAVLGAREACDKPIFVSCVFDGRGRMMTGASPEAISATLEGLGVTALGVNCSQGPEGMMAVVKALSHHSSLPIIVNPNAGLPSVNNGKTVYSLTPCEFSSAMKRLAPYAMILGGCCGTGPEYIRALRLATEGIPFAYPEEKTETVISSYTHAVVFSGAPVLIGERINPTGKPKLKAALREHNLDYIISEAAGQESAGADVLDVNVGLPEIDEPSLMRECIHEIQSVTKLPLCIDSSDPGALASAMRMYNGKPLVNSVNGKRESMSAVFPLVKKYGGVIIALTIDEDGIPDTAEGRVLIAEKIIRTAGEYGIAKKDIIVDPLTLSVSADKNAAGITLKAVKMLTERNIKTTLGVSNVSFGLPARDRINSVFFAEALACGLCAAIMNPYSDAMMNTVLSHNALSGHDDLCAKYIAKNADDAAPRAAKSEQITLSLAIKHGMRDVARCVAREYLANKAPLDIINCDVIPALGEIGSEFEGGRAYLPELLGAAEAAAGAFEEIKGAMPVAEKTDKKIILATVEGDIHDIGKNIVKVLLESYGFSCIDLGRDVSAEAVLDAVVKNGVRLVGLSALMTTTVGAMARTVQLIHDRAPGVCVMVGGAVLTPEYAKEISADFYGRDAMESVRIAEEFFKE